MTKVKWYHVTSYRPLKSLLTHQVTLVINIVLEIIFAVFMQYTSLFLYFIRLLHLKIKADTMRVILLHYLGAKSDYTIW